MMKCQCSNALLDGERGLVGPGSGLGAREEPQPFSTLSVEPPRCLSSPGPRKDRWALTAPEKCLVSWMHLHEAIFAFSQTHVYTQLSKDYHSNEGFFRRFSPKYFLEAAVRLQELTTKNTKPEVKGFDLARARHTSQAGSPSSPRVLFYQKKLMSTQAVQSLGLLFV